MKNLNVFHEKFQLGEAVNLQEKILATIWLLCQNRSREAGMTVTLSPENYSN